MSADHVIGARPERMEAALGVLGQACRSHGGSRPAPVVVAPTFEARLAALRVAAQLDAISNPLSRETFRQRHLRDLELAADSLEHCRRQHIASTAATAVAALENL